MSVYQLLTYAAIAYLVMMLLVFIAFIVGSWLGDRKSLSGKMMILGSNIFLPALGLWYWANAFGYGYLPDWATSDEMGVLGCGVCGLSATVFTVGFVLNRINRPEPPEIPLPHLPPEAGRLDV